LLKNSHLDARFVEYIPEEVEPGLIYVSMPYATAIHKCCCGCGEEVVTPFSPTDWKISFDGVSVSLWPSIGNWDFTCRSHYIIRDGRVVDAGPWNDAEIAAEKVRDRRAKAEYFSNQTHAGPKIASPRTTAKRRPLDRLRDWLRNRF
jgi:hypothetical protein